MSTVCFEPSSLLQPGHIDIGCSGITSSKIVLLIWWYVSNIHTKVANCNFLLCVDKLEKCCYNNPFPNPSTLGAVPGRQISTTDPAWDAGNGERTDSACCLWWWTLGIFGGLTRLWEQDVGHLHQPCIARCPPAFCGLFFFKMHSLQMLTPGKDTTTSLS